MEYLLGIAVLIVLLVMGSYFGAPWLPTRKNDFLLIEDLINFDNVNIFYDLGSGTGFMLFFLARKYRGIKFVGIEISPLLFLYSKIKSLFCKNVHIKYGNFLHKNLSDADVVYIFSIERIYEKIKAKLESELKRNAKIILSCWPMPNWEITKKCKHEKHSAYYLYEKSTILQSNISDKEV